MKKFFKNPWIRIIIGGVIVGIILSLIEWLTEAEFLQSIWGIIKIAFAWFFAAKLKVWIVLIIMFIVFWITSIIRSKPINTSPDEHTPPWVDEYRQDIFEEMLWKWQWEFDYNAKIHKPVNFHPFCPECDCILVWSNLRYKCPKCKERYSEKENDRAAERMALLWLRIKEKYADKSEA